MRLSKKNILKNYSARPVCTPDIIENERFIPVSLRPQDESLLILWRLKSEESSDLDRRKERELTINNSIIHLATDRQFNRRGEGPS